MNTNVQENSFPEFHQSIPETETESTNSANVKDLSCGDNCMAATIETKSLSEVNVESGAIGNDFILNPTANEKELQNEKKNYHETPTSATNPVIVQVKRFSVPLVKRTKLRKTPKETKSKNKEQKKTKFTKNSSDFESLSHSYAERGKKVQQDPAETVKGKENCDEVDEIDTTEHDVVESDEEDGGGTEQDSYITEEGTDPGTSLQTQVVPTMIAALVENLKRWLQESLTVENFQELRNHFTENFIRKILQEKLLETSVTQPSDNYHPAITPEILKDLQDYLSLIIHQLDEQLQQFCQLIDSNMLHETAIQKILSGKHDFLPVVSECIQIGCRRISALKTKEKQKKVEQERELASQYLKHLPIFFQQEMGNFVETHQGLCPKTLDKILNYFHDELIFFCKQDLTVDEIITNTESNLTVALQAECEQIRNKYLDTLQLNQTKIHRLVMHYKSKYEVNIDAFITSRHFLENDFSEQAYNNHHNIKKREITTSFGREIPSELDNCEPTIKHAEVLNHYIEKSKGMFWRKVAMKMGSTKPKGHDAKENRLPAPPAVPPPLPEVVKRAESRVTSTVKLLGPADDTFRLSHHAPKPNNNAGSTLLVQLTEDKIGLAVTEYNNDKYLPKAVQDEIFVPFEVAVTDKNDWYYGTGIKANDYTASCSSYQRQWKISSYFALPFSKSKEPTGGSRDTFTIDSRTHIVTPEFLLATLLGLVRLELEDGQNIKLDKVFIAVPFWYTSYTRGQIIDAAKIAGFGDEQIHVINENSCLAFLVLQDNSAGNEFDAVVVSENSGIVDTSVFIFDKERNKVQITGYSGMFEVSSTTETQKASLFNRLVPGVRKFMHFVNENMYKSSVLQEHMQDAFKKADQATVSGASAKHTQQMMSFTSYNNLLTFEGMALLHEYLMNDRSLSLESLIGSASPLKAVVVTPDGTNITLDTCQKSGKQKYIFKGMLEAGKYHFYQQPEICKEKYLFGTLTIQKEVEKWKTFEATLEMSQNGVIFLLKVEVLYNFGNYLLDETVYSWESRLLHDKDRSECENLFNNIYNKYKGLGDRHVKENSTQQFFKEMRQAFENGKGSYLSNIGKELVGKELQNINCTLDKNKSKSESNDLRGVQQRLKEINDKYKLTCL